MLSINDQVRLFECDFAADVMPQDLYHKLYEHYTSTGEMSYEVQKAITIDPYQWIVAKVPEFLARLT